MREPLATFEQHTSAVWMRFQKVVHPQVLSAPRISWDQVDRKLKHYINNSVGGTPWVNHLATWDCRGGSAQTGLSAFLGLWDRGERRSCTRRTCR